MQTNTILLEAIARRKCLTARYNRTAFKLAPHILYTKNDSLFIDAVALERDGHPPREIKIGSFKLDGLTEIELQEEPFEAVSLFDPEDAKYAGGTLFSVEV